MRDERLTVPEAAKILRVSTKTMYELLRDGSVRGYRVRGPKGEWRTTREEVEAWEDRQLTLATREAVDYRISSCAADYMTMERERLLSGIQDDGEDGMPDEARKCLEVALEALEDGRERDALYAAARGVAALEVVVRE